MWEVSVVGVILTEMKGVGSGVVLRGGSGGNIICTLYAGWRLSLTPASTFLLANLRRIRCGWAVLNRVRRLLPEKEMLMS